VGANFFSALVDPTHGGNQRTMVFLNMASGELMVELSVPGRKRLDRIKMRQMMLDGDGGVDVQWGKTLVSYTTTERGIKANFADGTEYEGGLLVGLDGVHSVVRAVLFPEHAKPVPVPVHMLGVELELTRELISPLLEVNPVMFLGGSPTGVCVFYAVLSSPEVNGTAALAPEEHRWHVQVNISWLKADGAPSVPESNKARVELLLERMTKVWVPLRNAVEKGMTSKTVVGSVRIADWVIPENPWNNLDGRVTIAGDAAHTMTMLRGEGFNNAVLDLHNLVQALQEIYSTPTDDASKRAKLISEYEEELRERSPRVVLASRQQCLTMHDWEKYKNWTKGNQWGTPHKV